MTTGVWVIVFLKAPILYFMSLSNFFGEILKKLERYTDIFEMNPRITQSDSYIHIYIYIRI